MYFRLILLALIVPIGGCALPGHASVTLKPSSMLSGPKEVAIIGRRGDVEVVLEEYLRAKGFRVKRFASVTAVAEATTAQRTEMYREAATRYAIETDWSLVDRCFGGGFRFSEFRIDLVDLKENEIVFSTKAKGYSEKCQPMSGSIFGDVAAAFDALWPKIPTDSSARRP